MEIEVKEPITLDDGKHEGTIDRVEYREEPYKYTDLYIKVKDFELKYGVPTSASTNSKLMKLLAKFTKIEKGSKVDPQKILTGQAVTFMTMQEENKEQKFVRIVDGSIKPKDKTAGD